MKQKRLMILMSIVALVISSFMMIGNAGAMYQSDGAVQNGVVAADGIHLTATNANGTTGGVTFSNWIAPSDGICVLSIDASGNMVTDPTILTKRDCDARLVSVTAITSNDTLANVCGKTGSNTSGLKYAAPGSSTCVTIDGSGNILTGISLKNLDRDSQMCNALGGVLANATGVNNKANGTSAMCIAYGWQFRGQDGSGNPLTFGAQGTTQASNTGFCYTSMRATGYTSSTCPSTSTNATTSFGWSVSSGNCVYAYGVAGPLNSALTAVTGSTAVIGGVTAAAGATVDLSTLTTQGACLANGGSWSNWIPMGPGYQVTLVDTSITKGVVFDLTQQAVNGDNGCLHCHSTLVQYNGPFNRYKDSYLQTGHKNMLRKVTPGLAWAGANGVVYTTDGTNAMTFGVLGAAGSALDGSNPMYYIYGDWMAALPSVAIAGSNYSCANCHSTGFSGGTAATPGVQSVGTPGYVGQQPTAAGAGYASAVKAGYAWDLEGINCSRCHNATVPSVTAAQIAASSFPSTYPTSSGMGNLADGVGRNNLCFGCHQSIAKLYPAEGGSTSGTSQFDPTIIPTGVSHGAAAGRDFNGHVLGNSFLNSVHARYLGAQTGNGSITPNPLGENDLYDSAGTAVAAEYNSIFKGYSCFQGSTSSSLATTQSNGSPITTQAQCTAISGYAWRDDVGGATTQSGYQGTCTTCHDVHNSLFVDSQAGAAIRKTCADCHVNNASTGATDTATPQVASFNHPQTPGTPFDTTLYPNGSCEVCHMATQALANGNQNSMPVHVWRINSSSTYSTFPTTGQFYNGTCSVHAGPVQNAPSLPVVYQSDTSSANCTANSGTWSALPAGTLMDRDAQTAPEFKKDATVLYNNAVWVDLDMACGQCHGGSFGSNYVTNNAPYKSKTELAADARNMHSGTPAAQFTWQQTQDKTGTVNFDASSATCPSGNCVYDWNFGDPASGANNTSILNTSTSGQHVFTPTVGSNQYTVQLMVYDTTNEMYDFQTSTVAVNIAPTDNFALSVTGSTVTLTDSSTSGSSVSINWGDGTGLSTGSAGGVFTHTYTTNNTFTIVDTATVSGISATSSQKVTVPAKYAVSGTVTNLAGTPLSAASLTLKLSGVTKGITSTNASGAFTFTNVVPGTYTITVTKSGYTFANPAATVPVTTGAVTGVAISSSN